MNKPEIPEYEDFKAMTLKQKIKEIWYLMTWKSKNKEPKK